MSKFRKAARVLGRFLPLIIDVEDLPEGHVRVDVFGVNVFDSKRREERLRRREERKAEHRRDAP
jgi:hypothetical protein